MRRPGLLWRWLLLKLTLPREGNPAWAGTGLPFPLVVVDLCVAVEELAEGPLLLAPLGRLRRRCRPSRSRGRPSPAGPAPLTGEQLYRWHTPGIRLGLRTYAVGVAGDSPSSRESTVPASATTSSKISAAPWPPSVSILKPCPASRGE